MRFSFPAVLAICGAASAASAGSITLPMTIRDFNSSPAANAHPDFEGVIGQLQTGAVSSTLGGDKNPVPVAGIGSIPGFTSVFRYNQWYNDVPGVNLTTTKSLTLTETTPGKYTYSTNAFFPIDGELYGNQGRGHNFHFTMELHNTFTYQGGETFEFTGDDDLWVFINGKLAVDLGGVHPALMGSVDLDTAAGALGLTIGGTYDFDLFFAERHTTQSNFMMETTIEFDNVIPLPQTAGLGALGLLVLGSRSRRAR